jgi:hypothetical protein
VSHQKITGNAMYNGYSIIVICFLKSCFLFLTRSSISHEKQEIDEILQRLVISIHLDQKCGVKRVNGMFQPPLDVFLRYIFVGGN